MPGQDDVVAALYRDARRAIVSAGYEQEVAWAESLPPLAAVDAETFFAEYVWVVLNSGMREQVARTIFDRFMAARDPGVIGHPGKRAAIARAMEEYPAWVQGVLAAADPVDYLEQLPYIGPRTKFHLARNIGVETVKPDRHLERLACTYGYEGSPLALCEAIRRHTGDRLGVIDVVLWRSCNLGLL